MKLIDADEAIRQADYLDLETGYDNEKVEEMIKELQPIKAIPLERLELIREHFELLAHFDGIVKADYVLNMLDKAIKEVESENNKS